MDEAGEVDGTVVVAGGEATEMLEATEAALDLVTMPVDVAIMRDGDLTVAFGKGDSRGVHACDPVAQVVAIICFVGKNGLGALAFGQISARPSAAPKTSVHEQAVIRARPTGISHLARNK